ncbi:DUF4331 family protein [Paraflavisolibacter sp. H34]|uniref:DUF4331 family protein n=1 Tax=Huijunlia imazamoxiresistens TaxID=3127457 RepID=UPI003015A2A8
MKRKIITGLVAGLALAGGVLWAADHIDAPMVTGAGSTSAGTDITDIYAFQSPADNSKMVFACNVMGLMSPMATATAQFPSNTLYEFNIDNTGDNVEDLVLQCLVQNGKLRVYGPVAPATTGTMSAIRTSAPMTEAAVTAYGSSPATGMNNNGIRVFAGPRDDPFFFDLTRFKEIMAGTQTAFRSPGMDTFAGTNVLSIVVEVPKSLLGSAATLNVWAETKTKQ